MRGLVTLSAAGALVGSLLIPGVASGTTSASAAPITLPDLQVQVPTNDISIGTNPSTGDRQLQFTHITWDAGAGPFAIQPTYHAWTGISSFVQDIYYSPSPGVWKLDHTVPLAVAGIFDSPFDYRFPLTRFTLNLANSNGTPGAVVAVSPKTDYCITGDTYVGGVPNTPNQTSPPQSNCANPRALLGFSVGWGDEYDQTDNGQPINLNGVPDGTYILHAEVDPEHVFTESNDTNDVVDTKLQIAGDRVTVLLQSSPLTVPPTIAMTTPAPDAQVQGSVELSASAAATAPAMVASVQYLLDGEPLGLPVTTTPYQYTWDVGNTRVGPHTLSAQVTDSAGNVGTAPVETVSVVAGTSGGLSVDTDTTRDGRGTVFSKAFSTRAAGETLVAFSALDGPAQQTQASTVTGAGLTWHLVARSDAEAGDAEVWTATAATRLSGVQVTSTPRFRGYDQQLTVVAFTGAAGTGGSASASGPSGPPSVTLTTTAAGSYSFAVGFDWDHAIARSPGPGQSLLHQWLDGAAGNTFWVQDAAATSAAAGQAITVDDTAPLTDRWDMAAVEVEPAPSPAPALSILNPPAGETVSTTTPLVTTANDVVPVRTVRFLVDGRTLAATASRRPYAVHWDTAVVGSGLHTLSAVMTDADGRTATTSERIEVSNPPPAMTCFVLQADVQAQGERTVTTPVFHTASAGERLLAFVRAPGDGATRAVLHGAGLAWHLLRIQRGAAGSAAVWTALARNVLAHARVSSRLATGRQDVTVVAMEGSDKPGPWGGASGRTAGARLSITTSEPTSLVFAAGVQRGPPARVAAGWVPISPNTAGPGAWTSWVRYTNQPAGAAGQRVAVPQPDETAGGWATVAVALPGDGS
jgi:hypothetical protein